MQLTFQPMTQAPPDEVELFVAFFVAGVDQVVVQLARRHQFKEAKPLGAVWTAWQFTCDGRQVPDTFDAIAWAEVPVSEIEDAIRQFAREVRAERKAAASAKSPVYAAGRRLASRPAKRRAAHG